MRRASLRGGPSSLRDLNGYRLYFRHSPEWYMSLPALGHMRCCLPAVLLIALLFDCHAELRRVIAERLEYRCLPLHDNRRRSLPWFPNMKI